MKTFISFLILCLIATCNAEQRTWTAVNGKEVEAEFFSNSDGQVSLKMKTGKVFRVPLDKLSKEDQDFIASISLLRSLKDNIVGKIITLEVQGNKTQTILSINGKVLSGINYDLKDINQTYEIIGNNVKLYAGISATPIVVMSFSSSNPKPADKIELKIIDNNASIAGKIIDIEHRAETKSVEEAPLNPNLKHEIKGEVGVKTADSKIAGYWVSDVKLTIKNLKALKAASSDDFEKRIYGENIESLEKGVGLEQMPLTLQSKTIIKIEDNGKMIIFMNDSKQVGTYSTKSSSKIIGDFGGRFSMTLDGGALRMMPLGQLDLETGFLPVMFSRKSPPLD